MTPAPVSVRKAVRAEEQVRKT
ncbi:uncharacterized, partial [Tachysurus ichikawai]